MYINLAWAPQFLAKLLNRNCYRLSRVSWALAQISYSITLLNLHIFITEPMQATCTLNKPLVLSDLCRRMRTGWSGWRRWRCYDNCRSSKARVLRRLVTDRRRNLSCSHPPSVPTKTCLQRPTSITYLLQLGIKKVYSAFGCHQFLKKCVSLFFIGSSKYFSTF